jgi:hypothetical protein
MNLDKNEIHILKHLRAYKYFSAFAMVFGAFMLLWNLYDRFFKAQSQADTYLRNQLIGASIAVAGMGYLMWHFIRLISKLRNTNRE